MTSLKRILLLGSCCFFLCLSVFLLTNKRSSVASKIQEIPVCDRSAIDTFFRIFLLKNAGAYVLFGDKPAAFDAYFIASAEEIISSGERTVWENMQLRKGWEVWEKYKHLFPSKRFLLQSRLTDDDRVEIVLLHKQRVIHIIEENLTDFQRVLGIDIAASDVLERYEQRNLPFFDVLNRHHALLGIVLGFGKRNSWLFQNRERIWKGSRRQSKNAPPFHLKSIQTPSQGFSTLEEEHQYYADTLTGAFAEGNMRKFYKFLYFPGFVVDPASAETHALQKKYTEEHTQIHKAYSHGNFLEVTLTQLCSSP